MRGLERVNKWRRRAKEIIELKRTETMRMEGTYEDKSRGKERTANTVGNVEMLSFSVLQSSLT